MKNIVICQGDENRAKIETELVGDIFFSEVYKRAENLLEELIEEAEEFEHNRGNGDCNNARYQRMGNNVIAFCAKRGQGKTTAMQSFARYLCSDHENAVLGKGLFERNDFVVLDSIDPAALDGGESLVRVVISRLFYLVGKKYDKECKSPDLKDKNKMLELFQQCYTSIDFLYGKRQNDEAQDDLEKLAALGNSAKLKRNLVELIDIFLKIYLDKRENKNRFLIVPIDDVDICTADIYRSCEEIRNYLTLPNVIVLLAVDHSQLYHVIYQKYLQTNKVLLQYEPNSAKAESNRQASGYLLKLLPNNHIVELPELDKLSECEWKKLKLKYMIRNQGKKTNDILAQCTKGCSNMQEQIVKVIYDRTGIILWDSEGTFWKFLPQTMRELTQLVKQLVTKTVIGHQELYSGKSSRIESIVTDLLNNIQLFKNYFLESWCTSYISHEQYMELMSWVDAMEKCKKGGTFTWKYSNILKRKYYKGLQITGNIPHLDIPQYVINMYLSIFLNEWFAEALSDERQYDKIADFLDITFEAQKNPSEDYHFFSFIVEKELLDKNVINENFKNWFLTVKGNKVYFDILNPWKKILISGYHLDDKIIAAVTSESGDSEISLEEIYRKLDFRLLFKNMVANTGIYQHVILGIVQRCNEYGLEVPFNWRESISSIYREAVDWIGQLKYLRLKGDDISTLIDSFKGQTNAWNLIFILNEKNKKKYCSEYQVAYSWLFDEMAFQEINQENVFEKIHACYNPRLVIHPELLGEYGDQVSGNSNDKISEGVWRTDKELKKVVLSQRIIGRKEELKRIYEKGAKTKRVQQRAIELLKEIRDEYEAEINKCSNIPDENQDPYNAEDLANNPADNGSLGEENALTLTKGYKEE